jgi:cytochrome c biogenesis protein CcmG, thiol:disulfide interchange protein DsbE
MSWSFLHPNTDALAGFASRALAAREERRVARHLESCTECRDTVAVLRAVNDGARDVQPREELVERILASRAAGQRTILPTDDATVMTRPRPVARLAGLATAGAVLAIILLKGSREVSAGERTGYLRLDPARPLPGALVRAAYTPSAFLQGFDSLVLRARFRRPFDEAYNHGPMQQRAAVLHRGSSGVFNGEFRLPDSVVFAVFAVESPSSDVVDDNDDRLWELLTVDDRHRPLYEALVQKERDLMGRDWVEGLRTVRKLTALYPEEPDAWSLLSVYERWVLGDRIADSLLTGHRRRFAAFHRELVEGGFVPSRTVLGMVHYAADTTTSRYWLRRLEREFPDDPDVLFRREYQLWQDFGQGRKDPGRYLRDVEPVWARAERIRDPDVLMMVFNALSHAIQTKDTAAIRVWVPRYRRVQRPTPGMATYWGKSLLQYPTLRPVGMAWLREEARLLAEGPDAYRPLNETIAEQRVANRATAQPVLAELANALIEDGDTTAGLDTLRLAASYGWRPAVFLRVADTWAALGDTTQALRTYAKVAADPGSAPGFADSIRAVRAPRLSNARWTSWVNEAKGQMRAAVLEGSAPRSLVGPMRLLSSTGGARGLNELAQGHVTVVAFWSTYCQFSVNDLGTLQRIANQFSSSGARVVAIVDHPFSDEVRRILKEQHAEDLPVFYDFRSDAKRAFVTFAWPDYYVLDASGKVVFSHSKLEAIPRQVAALLP